MVAQLSHLVHTIKGNVLTHIFEFACAWAWLANNYWFIIFACVIYDFVVVLHFVWISYAIAAVKVVKYVKFVCFFHFVVFLHFVRISYAFRMHSYATDWAQFWRFCCRESAALRPCFALTLAANSSHVLPSGINLHCDAAARALHIFCRFCILHNVFSCYVDFALCLICILYILCWLCTYFHSMLITHICVLFGLRVVTSFADSCIMLKLRAVYMLCWFCVLCRFCIPCKFTSNVNFCVDYTYYADFAYYCPYYEYSSYYADLHIMQIPDIMQILRCTHIM